MDIFHRTFGMALKRRNGHLGKSLDRWRGYSVGSRTSTPKKEHNQPLKITPF
jgi:hypothetical protein